MKESSFTGTAWGLFGWNLLLVLSMYLFVIPALFVFPKYLKWYYSHMVIDGEQLEFEYEGAWWGLIGWSFFIVITFGFGTFYAMKRIMQFEIRNTRVQGGTENESEFYGSAWGILKWNFIMGIAMYLLVFPVCYVIPKANKWYNENTQYSGRRLKFTFEGPWWGFLKWMLFTIVTLGIGSYYAQKKMIQWNIEHTHFA